MTHACPGACGRAIPEDKFLCNLCSDLVPDSSIVAIGAAIDRDDITTADAVIASAVADLHP
jgi:hypothetical protein